MIFVNPGSSKIQAIQAELAAKREESRKARAMAQLDAKQRYDAQHRQRDARYDIAQHRPAQRPVDARVVAGRRMRKSRGSGSSSKKKRVQRPTQSPGPLQERTASNQNLVFRQC